MVDPWDRFNKLDEFRGLRYQLEPDYKKPLLEVPEEVIKRVRRRLNFLYGEDQSGEIYSQMERIMRIHHAHATREIVEAEEKFDPAQRFTERDVVLITYGDIIISEDRTPLRTLADFAAVFFQGIITTLHILPFYPYSSDRGFSIISYAEVDPHLGTWDEIAELASSFRLMFDGVLNHISSKNRLFQKFLDGAPGSQDYFIAFESRDAINEEELRHILRPRTSPLLTEFYTIDGPRYVWTTFSPDQIDLNYKNPQVLYKVLEILLYYVRRGADIIRLDAITYIWRELGTSCANLEQTHEVVKLIRDVLNVVAPHVALITETNVPHEDNITYFGNGSDEAQMVYNFALPPLVLHTFQTGRTTALNRWASDLAPPSDTTCFFNFLDSHDGIGLMGVRGILSEDEIGDMCRMVEGNGGLVSVKDNGDGTQSPYELNTTWFSALNRADAGEPVELQIDRFVASRAVSLVLRGVPGIYILSLDGSKNDPEAVSRDNSKRSINRGSVLEKDIFEMCGHPDSIGSRIMKQHGELLQKRVNEPAFHPNGEQKVFDLEPRVFALLRISPICHSQVLSLINVTKNKVTLEVSLAEIGFQSGNVRDILTDSRFETNGDSWRFTLAPYQIAWLKEDDIGLAIVDL
jgi:glucosylglycerate phosphorylase